MEIEQAFTADFIAQGFGLPIAHENADYKPTDGVPYVEIKTFPNETTAFTLADMDQTSGFFQFILRYPTGGGAIAAKTMRETIFAAYPVGRRDIEYSGQGLLITGTYPFQSYPEDGWYKLIGRVNYRAISAR